VSTLYVFSSEDVVASLRQALDAAPDAHLLMDVEPVAHTPGAAYSLGEFGEVQLPLHVAVVRWHSLTLDQLEAVEHWFFDSLLPADPGALLWDLYNETLHSQDRPRCGPLEPVDVPAGPVSFHAELVMQPCDGRMPGTALLDGLQSRFPALLPRSYGEDEPLRRIAPGKATLEGFTDLWDAGRDCIWSCASGWTVYAHEVDSHLDGSSWGISMWLKAVLPQPAEPPLSGSDLVDVCRLFGAPVGRTMWPGQAVGGTPWPYCSLAPGGWWLGFDSTPHAAVCLAPTVVAELAPPFHQADDWVTRALPDGTLLAEARSITAVPPAEVTARLMTHTVAAPVRPEQLMRPR